MKCFTLFLFLIFSSAVLLAQRDTAATPKYRRAEYHSYYTAHLFRILIAATEECHVRVNGVQQRILRPGEILRLQVPAGICRIEAQVLSDSTGSYVYRDTIDVTAAMLGRETDIEIDFGQVLMDQYGGYGESSGISTEAEQTGIAIDPDSIYDHADQMPQYPGGDTALTRHLLSHMKLWTASSKPFMIEFIVERDGSVQRLDQPAPKYLPPEWELAGLVGKLHFMQGTVHGQAVRVRMILPVYIRHR